MIIYYFKTNLSHHQVHKCRINVHVVEWHFIFESLFTLSNRLQFTLSLHHFLANFLKKDSIHLSFSPQHCRDVTYLSWNLKGLIVKTVKMAWYLNVKTIISVCQMIIHTFCCYRFSIKWNGKVRNYFFEISKVLNLLGDDFVSDLFHM